MKIVAKFAHDGWRIALMVDRNEKRLDLRAELRLVSLEQFEACHRTLDIGRAEIGAIGIAEIDDPVLAIKIAPAGQLARLAGQFEFTANGGAGQRRLDIGSRLAAGPEREEQGSGNRWAQQRRGEARRIRLAVHGLLIGGHTSDFSRLMCQQLRKEDSGVRGVMRNFVWGTAMLSASIAAPVAAQSFSEGYKFLQAVEEREGQEVTDALNEPGTTIVNTRDVTTGRTALHIVTARRDTSWISFLTQRGANPNIRDNKGVSPLQLAIRLNHVEGVEALLKAGANVDVTDTSGETPLIAAVHARNTELVRLLLEKGASPDRTDNSGRTARDYAELMPSNGAVMLEFKRADEAREGKDSGTNYGPSF